MMRLRIRKMMRTLRSIRMRIIRRMKVVRGYEDVDEDEENENEDEDEEDEDDKMMSMKSMRFAKAEATPAGTTQFSKECPPCGDWTDDLPASWPAYYFIGKNRFRKSCANRRDMIFERVEQDSANTFRLFWTEYLRNLAGRTHRPPRYCLGPTSTGTPSLSFRDGVTKMFNLERFGQLGFPRLLNPNLTLIVQEFIFLMLNDK